MESIEKTMKLSFQPFPQTLEIATTIPTLPPLRRQREDSLLQAVD
jgi:hypothetical protein